MQKEKRFVKSCKDSGGFSGPDTMILVDQKTGVNYLFVQNGYAGGLTPLLDRDGRIVVTSTTQYKE